MMTDMDNVRWCPHCKCKTWHVSNVCEWSDLHPHNMIDGGGAAGWEIRAEGTETPVRTTRGARRALEGK